MRILFTHKNFPAQFRHMAEHLGKDPNNEIIFATTNPRLEWDIPGVKKAVFTQSPASGQALSPMQQTHDEAVRYGTGLLAACRNLKKQGFEPDIVVGHSGWGQTLFLRDIFPRAPFLAYYEWYYNADGPEITFDGRERSDSEKALIRMRNTAILHDLTSCAGGISPTLWQKSQFPQEFRHKIAQIHDGINTNYFAPAPEMALPDLPRVDLSGATELLTYCSRGLEPYRGFPQFYRALPHILRERPGCHVLIVGEDRICYSPRLPNGQTYKQKLTGEVQVDESRVHFTGPLPYGQYKQVLQASSVHVYLTWPFVLSWSFLEAMSCGCLIVGSDTAPVREVLAHGYNGLLTDFHSHEQIARDVVATLKSREKLKALRTRARQTIVDRYCLTRTLPRQLDLLRKVAEAGPRARINVEQKGK
ncbi:glycosyltransferase [Salidesulfovibrio onnuriiensis]|uniref:glycosyltransferase n=1 Tax=Salidesulfovibrio onnuriiensis TaxID=2583823 RepID=UPI0011CB7B36|nr:glycosyltransferase [Salidesulfovibrio onnuriiensis]